MHCSVDKDEVQVVVVYCTLQRLSDGVLSSEDKR